MHDETISVLAISGNVRHDFLDFIIKSLEPLKLKTKARKGASAQQRKAAHA
jgi:hypothetical protein